MPNKKILIAAAAVITLILAIAFKPIRIALLVLLLLMIAALAVDVVIYINASRDGVDISAKYFGIKVYPRRKKGGGDTEEAGETDPDWGDDDSFEDDLDYETTETQTQEMPTEQTSEPQETQAQPEEETTEDTDTSDESSGGEQWDGEPDDEDEPEPKKKSSKKRENPIVSKVKSLRARYEKYKPYIPMAWKGFRQLCKTIRFYIDDAWVDVGRFDAHEAAIYYGSIQAVIAETFKDIAVMFTLKPRNVKRCDVNVKWGENCIDGGIKMRVKLRLLTIVGILISMAVKYLFIKFSNKRKSKAKNETTAENVQPE